ncbi:Up-regulated during septation-domain-containing protein [Podospora fimiseda]|uniref:Up-regulated during septation-domain-containing protein n=1 Tax=Podospora fimiseda TaxID=252190 RepID=A0AAN7BSJ2_9PEZI|nr:Up-regulated during septation-domain-containing protein [Podospora fimiseda]
MGSSQLAGASSVSSSTTTPGENKPFTWRMQQTERKYQLFPKGAQTPTTPAKALDPEQAFALAMGDKTEKTTAGAGLRIRIKEHNLIRRRKISVPELGPMTTVQEVAMDSPTIPGRPPFHERSISAPGHWKHVHLADTSMSTKQEKRGSMLKQPLSPKNLTPLVIPTSNSAVPRLTRQPSLNRMRSATTPIDSALRSAKTDDSPRLRTPFTPMSAALTPKSAATTVMTNSTLPTPLSAPAEARSSPMPWEKATNYAVICTPKETSPNLPATKMDSDDDPTPNTKTVHKRNVSDTGSIMERGRPRKRSDITGTVAGRSVSKKETSAERRAFEQLPKGWKASEAVKVLSASEVASLHKQALGQAARFEVLRKQDVDNLSRELRHLDERTEYLRRTYNSLRAGRRNLHTRICQYLRSPRTAKFSHDSMLKQEEALAELDTSIDDWVNKLEKAENRRTRVRQKLLEHVAAAATLAISPENIATVNESLQQAMGVRPLNYPGCPTQMSTPPRSPTKTAFTQTESPSSPPRVVAHVPSTIIEHPLFEEPGAMDGNGESYETTLRRAETIRIYADNDVYSVTALLLDVEDVIAKMGSGDSSPAGKEEQAPIAKDVVVVRERSATRDDSLSDAERKKIHRTRSHGLLRGSPAPASLPALPCTAQKLESKTSSSSLPSIPPTSTTTTTLSTSAPSEEGPLSPQIFLTNAVFRP